MELTDQISINLPRESVFAALNDAEILRQAIPGCEAIESTADNQFTATVSAKVGPLKARFKGQVTLSDIVVPESYSLKGEGRGGPAGHAKVQAQVRLTENNGVTLLDYEVKADIGGKLAQLGGQLVQNTAQKLAAEFFNNFEALLVPPDAPASQPSDDDGEPIKPDSAASKTRVWIVAGLATAALAAYLTLS